jgi:hypothetical protein
LLHMGPDGRVSRAGEDHAVVEEDCLNVGHARTILGEI